MNLNKLKHKPDLKIKNNSWSYYIHLWDDPVTEPKSLYVQLSSACFCQKMSLSKPIKSGKNTIINSESLICMWEMSYLHSSAKCPHIPVKETGEQGYAVSIKFHLHFKNGQVQVRKIKIV